MKYKSVLVWFLTVSMFSASVPCLARASVPEAANSVLRMDGDGQWKAFRPDGEYDASFSGILDYDGESFFVGGGRLCDGANELQLCDGEWYYLSAGQIQSQYSGLAMSHDGHWFMIRDGRLDTSANGLYTLDGRHIILAGNHILDEESGEEFDPSAEPMFFVACGQVQTQYSGVVLYENRFFVVSEGRFRGDYNGAIAYDGFDFVVDKGILYNKTINVYVDTEVYNIRSKGDSYLVAPGGTLKLRAYTRPERDVYWSSSDEDIATVDQKGVVTGCQAGSTVITAECDGSSYSRRVIVQSVFQNRSGDLVVNDGSCTVQLNLNASVESVRYTIDDTTVASAQWGEPDYYSIPLTITGRRNGVTTVTISTPDSGDTLVYRVIVRGPEVSQSEKRTAFGVYYARESTLEDYMVRVTEVRTADVPSVGKKELPDHGYTVVNYEVEDQAGEAILSRSMVICSAESQEVLERCGDFGAFDSTFASNGVYYGVKKLEEAEESRSSEWEIVSPVEAQDAYLTVIAEPKDSILYGDRS